MAIQPTDLLSSSSRTAAKRIFATYSSPKQFANVAGAPELAAGTPVVYDTSAAKWKVWTAGGANGTGTIRGIVWPDAIQLHATNDVIGTVMLRGRAHADDIVLPSGETQNDLDAALKIGDPALRESGIDIEGLSGVA